MVEYSEDRFAPYIDRLLARLDESSRDEAEVELHDLAYIACQEGFTEKSVRAQVESASFTAAIFNPSQQVEVLRRVKRVYQSAKRFTYSCVNTDERTDNVLRGISRKVNEYIAHRDLLPTLSFFEEMVGAHLVPYGPSRSFSPTGGGSRSSAQSDKMGGSSTSKRG